MIAAIACLGGIGLLAGVMMGIVTQIFPAEVDTLESEILKALPGANCGACGFPGCAAYAKALAIGQAEPNLCIPGGTDTVERIAALLGVAAESVEPQKIAVVLCQGDTRKAQSKYHYLGIEDCREAQMIAEGPKKCPAGCLGLGTCARVCPFGAIEITSRGLAVISREKCQGCRKCVSICPRSVIRMTPLHATVHVLCNSHDRGAMVRKYCQIGCTACRVCEKTAPEAYRIENNLALVVYEQHTQAISAVDKCPTQCIRDFRMGYPEGSSFASQVALLKKRGFR